MMKLTKPHLNMLIQTKLQFVMVEDKFLSAGLDSEQDQTEHLSHNEWSNPDRIQLLTLSSFSGLIQSIDIITNLIMCLI